MRAISQAAFLIGGINNKFYRERIFTGKAPTGRSAGSQSCEGTQSTNTSAYPRGSHFRESYAASSANVVGTIGGLSMQSYQIIIINGTLRAIGAFLLLSRRAHLLTTHKMGGGTAKAAVRSPRGAAPSEPCGSCRKAVTFRAVACPTTALSTLYHSLDSVGIAAATPSITHKNSQYFLTRRCRNLLYTSQFFKGGLDATSLCKRNKNTVRKV